MAEDGPTEEEMFFIAADLTLYSNPLNKALGNASLKKEEPKKEGKKKEEKEEEKEPEPAEDEFIASDMNKYDSPLADLDTRYNQKHEVNQQAQEKNLQEK